MSDVSQGSGWWQASDGKWYSPDQATGAPAAGVAPTAAAPTRPPPSGPPSGYGPPSGPPAGYGPPAGAPAGYGAPTSGTPGHLAEWGQRVVATLIDSAFLVVGYIIVFVLGLLLSKVSSALGAIVLVLGYLAILAAGLYFSYLTGVTGQSPGKRLTGIRVVGEQTGQPIGGGGGIVRYFAHIVDSICMIGYLFPLWDPKKQTFADKIQTTVVTTGAPKQPLSADIFKK